ncbi:histidine triad (HIT) family protein [Litorivivens lipolytica]|uniref:Histidine triad (HIT) family protein n=1 Tax=Litorivivens lipolytica TaxID=1524264 RepID=A0A7W4W292_9GAMM|nr:HIT family protein [Litorivivens lipolytica]MBB3046102.1 histidine triad (HIT) family protein [Litorivivens lipolytica]
MSSIFSKIIAGELPGHFVWRDDRVVAFMTIAPIVPGHLLVVPVEEIDHWDDMPEKLANHCLGVARVISRAQKAVYGCQRVALQIIGLEVPHTHLHLVPINTMEDTDITRAKMAEADALAAEAEKLRAELVDKGFKEARL